MAGKIIELSATPPEFDVSPDELEQEMFESEIPVQHTHLDYEDDEKGIYVGVWDTTSMIESAGPYPCDEFMWLLEGEAEIENSRTGAIEVARAGEAFVIPRGYHCRWRQRGYLRKFFLILEPPGEPILEAPTAERIIKPAVSARQISTTEFPLLSLDVEQPPGDNRASYRDATSRFVSASWTGGPFATQMRPTEHHLFVYLVEGVLLVEEQGGQEQQFHPGDACFIPSDTVCRVSAGKGIHICYAGVRESPPSTTKSPGFGPLDSQREST